MDLPFSDIHIGQATAHWAEKNHLFVSYKPLQESTNSQARAEAFEENLRQESLCLYLTDHQTAGRGRGTNTWLDTRSGSSLLSSWSFLLSVKPQPTTSCLIGLAVYRACASTWPFLPWNLKAPNDIYIGEQKVAGLLLESLIQGQDVRLIAGLGFNITASPESLPTATSLLRCLPKNAPLLAQDFIGFLDRLLLELIDAIAHCDEKLSSTDQLSLLMALNLHPLLPEKYTGVDPDGSLLTSARRIDWSSL